MQMRAPAYHSAGNMINRVGFVRSLLVSRVFSLDIPVSPTHKKKTSLFFILNSIDLRSTVNSISSNLVLKAFHRPKKEKPWNEVGLVEHVFIIIIIIIIIIIVIVIIIIVIIIVIIIIVIIIF